MSLLGERWKTSMYALFVKVNGVWSYQGSNSGKSHEYPIEKFKANVREDAEESKNARVKTTAYKIVNLDTDEIDSWDVSELSEESELPAKAGVPVKFPSDLVVGHKYRIYYKLPTWQHARRSVVTYRGMSGESFVFYRHATADRCTLEEEWLHKAEEVDMNLPSEADAIIQ